MFTKKDQKPKGYVAYPVSLAEVKKQRERFEEYLSNVPEVTAEEIEIVLAEREQAGPEEVADLETRAAFERLMTKLNQDK